MRNSLLRGGRRSKTTKSNVWLSTNLVTLGHWQKSIVWFIQCSYSRIRVLHLLGAFIDQLGQAYLLICLKICLVDYCYKERQNPATIALVTSYSKVPVDFLFPYSSYIINLPTILMWARVSTALLNWALLLLILCKATSMIDLRNSLF